MKTIRPASARTFCGLSAALVLAGGMIMSPSGAGLALIMAGLFSLIVGLFGRGKTRMAAVVLLLAAIGLFAARHPQFEHDQETYRRHHDLRSHER